MLFLICGIRLREKRRATKSAPIPIVARNFLVFEPVIADGDGGSPECGNLIVSRRRMDARKDSGRR
jgi:hypothetical protein